MGDDFADILRQILMPYAMEEWQRANDDGIQFVHYTTADTALKILTPDANNERFFWMRNSLLMNDFSEVEYGQGLLNKSFYDLNGTGGELKGLLDDMFPSFHERLCAKLRHSDLVNRADTYLLSISEHGSQVQDEDKYGRLSMWRAYAAQNGVALVLNNHPFLMPSSALAAYSSPVFYADHKKFEKEFARVVANVRQYAPEIRKLDPDYLLDEIELVFRFAVLSTKHPGFCEEAEWRVIHSPTFEPSKRLVKEIVSVSGIPQTIYKIPLKNYPDEGFTGATVPELIRKIIIGPTTYAWTLFESFVSLLTAAGVGDAAERVVISDIPLRV